MKVILIPEKGVEVNGKPLLLGSSLSDAEAVLGKSEHFSDSNYYFCDADFALDFGDDGKLLYIECRSDTEAEIYGINAFETKADKLYDILAAENGDDIDGTDDGHSYIFNKIRISIWRETTPEEVLEMIQEAEDDAEPMPEDVKAEEMIAAEHWDTVGVFVDGYYD